MTAARLETFTPTVPAEDGSIDRSLAELESKITAWTAAVRDAQQRLAAAARAANAAEPLLAGPLLAEPQAAEPGSSGAVEPRDALDPARPDRDVRPVGADTRTPPPDITAAPESVGARAEQPTPPDAARSGESSAPSEGGLLARLKHLRRSADTPAEGAAAKQPTRASGPLIPVAGTGPLTAPAAIAPPVVEDVVEEDEEALLASLDAKTAKAIRIRRRLGGHARSVRQLLEEMGKGR